jgi:hypothetical protein
MNKILIYVLACTLGLAACGEAEQAENKAPETKVVLPHPFKSIQKLMVRPGLDFYIMNWGEGADTLSAVLVLRSDTLKQENTAYNLEIEGKKGKYPFVVNANLSVVERKKLLRVATAISNALKLNTASALAVRFENLLKKITNEADNYGIDYVEALRQVIQNFSGKVRDLVRSNQNVNQAKNNLNQIMEILDEKKEEKMPEEEGTPAVTEGVKELKLKLSTKQEEEEEEEEAPSAPAAAAAAEESSEEEEEARIRYPTNKSLGADDDIGNLITSNEWNLTTGIKATIVVVREEDKK